MKCTFLQCLIWGRHVSREENLSTQLVKELPVGRNELLVNFNHKEQEGSQRTPEELEKIRAVLSWQDYEEVTGTSDVQYINY